MHYNTQLVVESGGNVGIQMLCPNNRNAYVMFGDPDAKLIEMENEMLRRAQSFGMSREDLDGYLKIGQTEAAPPADLKNLDSNQKLGIFRQLNKKAPQ